jgi:hypothetical protein
MICDGGDCPFCVGIKFVITGVRWSGLDIVWIVLYLFWLVVDVGRKEKKLFCVDNDVDFFVCDIGRFPLPSIKLLFVGLPLPIGLVNDGTGRRDLEKKY